MSVKESGSLQFNDISWRVSLLGEQVILMECAPDIPIDKIHDSTHLIEKLLADDLNDIVPAYHSIAIFTSLSIVDVRKVLNGKKSKINQPGKGDDIIELPICYEVGFDLERVAEHANFPIEKVIDIHLSGTYRSLFMGFTPGFIYADGLADQIACPRLDTPRKLLPAGAVGIAGTQTGIYSLQSPGGWNIIGRTPTKIFDLNRKPPILIDVGTQYRFVRISQKAFETWGS
ncbi:inhibitor of KinA [Ekhidna lutea]|uniref:Inhibitor of KinA n=1 Tax=Ekhidna lutea TaxID=447679 RepID=A0A239F0D1_EKHLU|nr:5-oxoprolinase subunit PxpB [Ekhidna lutea]SNS49544.1 inhibitor of KinA [Ekhidna lutea]